MVTRHAHKYNPEIFLALIKNKPALFLHQRFQKITFTKSRRSNDPSSATRRTGGNDCNHDAPAGFAAAHG